MVEKVSKSLDEKYYEIDHTAYRNIRCTGA